MTSRVRLAAGIPQAWTTGGIDRPRMRRFLERADALGFESAWVVEQVLGALPSLEPVELLAWAAAVTDRIRLGTAVLLTPLRSPVHLAKSLATVDQLSGGRLDVGIGLGGEPEGLPRLRHQCGAPGGALQRGAPAHAGPLDRAARDLRRRVLAARGRRAGAEAAPASPSAALGRRAPPRRASPVHRLGARASWGPGPRTTATFAQEVVLLRGFLAEAGRDPASIDVGKRVYVAVDQDRERAGRRLAEYFGGFYGRPAAGRRGVGVGLGRPVRRGPPRGHRRRRAARHAEPGLRRGRAARDPRRRGRAPL